MKSTSKLTSIHALVLILCFASSAVAASFSVDIVREKRGKAETGKFYLSDQNYRLKLIEDGKPMVILADRGEEAAYVTELKAMGDG